MTKLSNRTIIRTFIRLVAATTFYGGILFFSAGTIRWCMGWIYLAIFLLFIIATIVSLSIKNPELFLERLSPNRKIGMKKWDIPLASTMALIGPVFMIVVAGLDKRFAWSTALSAISLVPGPCMMILGCSILLWAMLSNNFFSPVVRLQTDRNHTVAQNGPYQYIRHPGYLGSIIYYLGIPLVLESRWAFIPAIVTACMTILRTFLEDRTLQKELGGYKDYANRVGYRLIPWIW